MINGLNRQLVSLPFGKPRIVYGCMIHLFFFEGEGDVVYRGVTVKDV